MPFTSLLLTALVPEGKVEENHVGITITRVNNNETILLFSADESNYFHRTYLQKYQSGGSEPSCCDAVCFAQLLEISRPRLIICFVELKKGGSAADIKKAVEQISKTYEGVKMGIDSYRIPHLNITWKALIISKSSLPGRDIDPLLKPLKEKIGGDRRNIQHYRQIQKNVNLTRFVTQNILETI